MYVYLHTCKCINKRKPVCSTCLTGPRKFCNISYIWCKLHNYRLLCILLNSLGYFKGSIRIGTKGNSAGFYIRTGNIYLKKFNYLIICKSFHYFYILFCSVAADICHNYCVYSSKLFQISFYKNIYSRILKSYCIKHTGGGFRYSRSLITLPRYIRNPFCSKSA